MARRKRKKSSCPDPINGFIDFCAGATMAVIAKNKLKKDIENGEGEESRIAGTIVLGHHALKGNPIGLGGMVGLRSALNVADKNSVRTQSGCAPQIAEAQHPEVVTPETQASKYVWRDYCSPTNGINPQDYETADGFYEAVLQSNCSPQPNQLPEIGNAGSSDVESLDSEKNIFGESIVRMEFPTEYTQRIMSLQMNMKKRLYRQQNMLCKKTNRYQI